MRVNTINEKQVKQELKNCSKSVKDYIKALENDVYRKQHVINKALAKIKEQSEQLIIPVSSLPLNERETIHSAKWTSDDDTNPTLKC